jgi:transcriptional regulator with XRE-family HTH domain
MENRLGKNIHRAMEARRIKLSELARLAGIDSGQLCRVIKGEASLSIQSLERIAAALGVSAGFLLDGETQGDGATAKLPPNESDPELIQLLSDPGIAVCLRALGKLSESDKRTVAKVILRFAQD